MSLPVVPARKGSKSSPERADSTSASPAPKPLSPRGRGSVAQLDDDRLVHLFAQNMRLVRLHRQLSQEALADLCDLDRTYVSSVERRQRNISIRNIQRIADALQVDPRTLLDPQLSDAELAKTL